MKLYVKVNFHSKHEKIWKNEISWKGEKYLCSENNLNSCSELLSSLIKQSFIYYLVSIKIFLHKFCSKHSIYFL